MKKIKEKKVIIGIAVLLIVSACIFVGVSCAINKKTWETHEISNDADWGDTINDAAETTYYIENVKKSDFENISAHGYIKKVTSTLNAHTDKLWLMFLFDDGTGIYYPGSDVNEGAFYGVIDTSTYTMTETYGTITIKGSQVEYNKMPSYFSADSQALYALIPEEFTNDTTYANYDENIAYYKIATARTDIFDIAQSLCDATLNLKPDISEIHLLINETPIMWTPENGLFETEWNALLIL